MTSSNGEILSKKTNKAKELIMESIMGLKLKLRAKSRYKRPLIILTISVVMIGLTGCSKYQSEWDCGAIKGIGCSSIEEAEKVAREQILLNTGRVGNKKIMINEHYEDFKKKKSKIIEAK